MNPVRFAVVGCGNIGSRHLAILNAQPGATLAAFCDTDPAKREKFSAIYEDTPVFASIDEMLANCDASVINICTPHYLHAEHALTAIEAGRNVLVEKPMALRSVDASQMISAAARAGVLLMVVKQNRHNVPVVLTREAFEAGHLGRILLAQCNVVWNRYPGYYAQSPWLGRRDCEGGALYTQVSHFLDLLIWLCGDVIDAGCRIETKNHTIEIEDCGTAWLRFASGTMGTLFWTTCAYNRNFEGSITLVGEHGLIKIGGQYLNRIEHWDVEGFPLREGTEWVDRPNSYGPYQGTSSNHDKVIQDVIRRVNREDVRVVSGEDAIRTVQAIELIYANCGDGPAKAGHHVR
jgi:UDP-N-acetyl-2-amino-2-deoxyglucuronate dehydrogenase